MSKDVEFGKTKLVAKFVTIPGNAIQLDVRENVRFVIEFFQKYQKSYL